MTVSWIVYVMATYESMFVDHEFLVQNLTASMNVNQFEHKLFELMLGMDRNKVKGFSVHGAPHEWAEVRKSLARIDKKSYDDC